MSKVILDVVILFFLFSQLVLFSFDIAKVALYYFNHLVVSAAVFFKHVWHSDFFSQDLLNYIRLLTNIIEG